MADLAEIFRQGVGPGRVLERMWVVSPYVAEGFFEDLAAHLKPRRVHLVVDETTPKEAVDAARRALTPASGGPSTLVGVSHATAPGGGLVHAKLYFLQWGGPKKGAPKLRYLFWGSANATDGGFARNAETLSWARVTQGAHGEVLDYFETLRGAAGHVEEVQMDVTSGSALWLPAFSFSAKPPPSGLDAWLQRGVLFHPFADDPAFLRFTVNLDKPLPGGPMQAVLKTSGFSADGDPNVIRARYLPVDQVSELDGGRDWRARYFVDTSLGLWTSAECYRKRRSEFVKASSAGRTEALERVKAATPAEMKDWVSAFVLAVRGFAANVADGGLADPKDHFRFVGASLNENHYRTLATEKVLRDQKKAKDDWFRVRYTSGYQQVDVPSFRSDVRAWRSFRSSWGSALSFEVGHKGSRNLLAKAVRGAAKAQGDPLDEDGLVEWLDQRWDAVGADLMAFYK